MAANDVKALNRVTYYYYDFVFDGRQRLKKAFTEKLLCMRKNRRKYYLKLFKYQAYFTNFNWTTHKFLGKFSVLFAGFIHYLIIQDKSEGRVQIFSQKSRMCTRNIKKSLNDVVFFHSLLKINKFI